MLRRAKRVASEKMMQIEIVQQYVMIFQNIDHDSQYLRQRERAISERVQDKREIVHVVNANHVRVVVEFLNRHLKHADVRCEILDFSVFRIYLIVDMKANFDVVFESVKQIKIALTTA